MSLKMDLRDLFEIGEPTKVFIKNSGEIIELQPKQELGYKIINLDTPNGSVRENGDLMIVSFLLHRKISDIEFIDLVIQKIQSLRFIELTTFLEFHFNALRPSLKRNFLKFIQLYVLHNEDLKVSYRDSIKVWYDIHEAENKIYKKDKPTYNWNDMVWTYEAFFANCNFDYGIEAFNKELESLKTDSPDYEQKKSEIETKIKEASTRHKQHVQELYDELWEQEFQLTCHFAEQELRELFVNEKYDFLKSTVKPKLKELEKEFYRLSNKFKMTYVFNVEYKHTFMKLEYFFNTVNWFNEVVLNVIEPPVNVSDSIKQNSENNTTITQNILKPDNSFFITEDSFDSFNTSIFKDLYSYQLFLFLVEKYVNQNRPKEFSQIYRFMIDNEKAIKPNKGKVYQEFVLENYELDAKFSRIEEENINEQWTIKSLASDFKRSKLNNE